MEKRAEKKRKKMMEKMKANLEEFYNNQFKRDAELLNILRKR